MYDKFKTTNYALFLFLFLWTIICLNIEYIVKNKFSCVIIQEIVIYILYFIRPNVWIVRYALLLIA